MSNSVQPLILKKADGKCNLCERTADLTDDHIPPKSCGNIGLTYVTRLLSASLKAPTPTSRRFNGLAYRTLCSDCNGRLGRHDGALKEFYERIRALGRTMLTLPQSLDVPGARSVLISVLGHFVAARLSDVESTIEPKLREFILNKSKLDPAIQVYCWVYPYDEIVVARDFTFVDPSSVGTARLRQLAGVASVIKFNPLGFMVVHAKSDLTLPTMHQLADVPDGEYGYVRLDLAKIQHVTWPERPWKLLHVVLAGAEFINATSSYQGAFGAYLMRTQQKADKGAIDVGPFEQVSADPAFRNAAWLIDRRDDPRRHSGLI